MKWNFTSALSKDVVFKSGLRNLVFREYVSLLFAHLVLAAVIAIAQY